tara:strand:+ start:1293 stop:2240 length:948 start_codon:yes stop_codon:yes gene_type:complete
MKKILMLLFVLLFIVGCEENGTTDTTSTGASTSAFVGGDKGLEITFVKGTPPEEVFDSNYPFNINLRLENVGEADIAKDQAIIRVKGISPADFGNVVLENKNKLDLRGANLDPNGNVVDGGIETIDFADLQASEVTGNVEYPLVGEVCYPYKTKTVAKICILEDLLGKTRKAGEEPLCIPDETKDVENSGAPVKIENFKEVAVAEDKISFSFDIVHVGDGLIFKEEGTCEPKLEDKNKVILKVDSGIENAELKCNELGGGTKGEVNLFGDSKSETRSVVCTQALPERTDSEKQINIEISYRYQDRVESNIIVKHI